MNKFRNLFEMLMFAPDSGDGDGGGATEVDGASESATESTEGATTVEPTVNITEKEKVENTNIDLADLNKPKVSYLTQLNKEHQTLDLSEVPSLDDLVSHYQSNKERNERSIEIPKAGSKPEEVRAFLSKMGVPESSDKYEFVQGNLDDASYNSLKETLQKECFNSALSSGQAKSMWNMVNSHFVAQKGAIESSNQQVIDSFQPRFDSYLKDTENILDGNARVEKMTENANLFKKFADDTGMGNLFAKLGLNLNPEFISKMAGYQKKTGGGTFVNGQQSGKDGKNSNPFGDSFNNTFKT
jgi:hypothetical protein